MVASFKRQLPKVKQGLPVKTWSDCYEQEKYIDSCIIENEIIQVEEYDKVFFDQMIFKNVTFIGSFFQLLECVDVIFDHCDFSNASLNQAVFHRVEFRQCKMAGTQLAEAHFQHVLFVDTLAPYVECQFTRFKHVMIEKSVFKHANFFEAKLEKVELQECQLDEASFYEVDLAGIDLSASNFERIAVTSDKLKGCIISPEQAIGFVKAFGMVVNEK